MNIQSIDLNLLVAFESLMDERNVTRAAKRIGLSQPAMSNALARLRQTFDDPLLVRTPKGMVPTSAAQALIIPVRSALLQLRTALEEKPAFNPGTSRRTFHLLTNDYVEMVLLAPLVRALSIQAHHVSLRVQRPSTLFQPPSPAALADTFDLAFGFFPDVLSLDASVHSDVLWEEKNVCIARAAHPSIRGKLSLAQYATAAHAAVFYKSEGPGVLDTLLAQRGYSRRLVLQVPHFATLLFIVADSDLIATVPEHMAEWFGAWLHLRVLPVPLAIPPFRLRMLWHERAHADPAHRWLRQLIVDASTKLYK